jgi:peptide/nickel transport system permease protein
MRTLEPHATMSMKNTVARRSRLARVVRNNALAIAAAVYLLTLTIVSTFAQWIAPFQVSSIDVANALLPPSLEHPFGTDELGHGLLTRLLHGTHNTIGLAGASVMVASSLGALLGMLSGYFGRWPDLVIMRASDLVLAFPGLLLALTLLVFIGPSAITIIVILGTTHMPRYVRLIRSVVLGLREREFVYAARAVGATSARIIGRHVLPNALAPLIVYATLDLGFVVAAVAGLNFLGFGLGPPAQSWGQLLAEGRAYTAHAPWMATFPGVVISLSVLSFNLIGDALRDALDPKLRKSA